MQRSKSVVSGTAPLQANRANLTHTKTNHFLCWQILFTFLVGNRSLLAYLPSPTMNCLGWSQSSPPPPRLRQSSCPPAAGSSARTPRRRHSCSTKSPMKEGYIESRKNSRGPELFAISRWLQHIWLTCRNKFVLRYLKYGDLITVFFLGGYFSSYGINLMQ